MCEWCFGPLEVVYDYEAIAPTISRQSIAAGPKTIWRYADLLPASAEGAVDLGAGLTPLLRADRLGAELGLVGPVAEERHGQPDRLVQGPGRVGGPDPGP